MAKSKPKQTSMSAQTVLYILVAFLLGMLTVIAIYQFKYSKIKKDMVMLTEQPVKEITITLDQVKLHATADDCWQVIDGVVYNFTEYITSGDHPGGAAMVKDCGTDATDTYKNRPPHSEYATSLLPDYKLGMLATEEVQ